ncbi:MAG: T9SS type A sorting domain-containing protein [Saprospiraceae bacterium]
MYRFRHALLFCLFSYSFSTFCLAQEVITFTNVTANGGVSVDKDGNIFIAHFGPLPPNPSIGKDIYKITPTGEVSLFVDNALNVGSGNAIDADGFMYQSNFATGAIYKIAPDGTVVDNNYANVAGPVGITVGSDNSLYICSCNQNQIKKVSPTGAITTFASGSVFNCANGITQDTIGNLYTTNFSDGRITKVTPDGTTSTLGSTPAGNGHPVYRAADDALYIASYSGQQIFRMDMTGNVELFAGTGASGITNAVNPLQATFSKPNGINISNDDCTLYISQDGNVLRAILFNDGNCGVSDVESIEQHPNFKVYPNPVVHTLHVEYDGDLRFINVQLIDGQGRKVKNIPVEAGSTSLKIDVAALTASIYTLYLQSEENKAYTYRFIKPFLKDQ